MTHTRKRRALTRDFFARPVDVVARDLIGVLFLVDGAGGVIVETESYDHEDPAAHCYLERRTERNAAMFGPPARAYVYRSYGIHWCLNFVCQGVSGVLIRALEPTHGLAAMEERRGTDNIRNLCSGPGKLCEALGITGAHNHASLLTAPFRLYHRQEPMKICVGPRIGITKACDVPRRFGRADSRYVSRPFAKSDTARKRASVGR